MGPLVSVSCVVFFVTHQVRLPQSEVNGALNAHLVQFIFSLGIFHHLLSTKQLTSMTHGQRMVRMVVLTEFHQAGGWLIPFLSIG